MEAMVSTVKVNPAEMLAKARQEPKAGQAIRAVSCLQLALANDGTNVEAIELLGIAYAGSGNVARAIQALTRATELAPARASGHYNLALILAEDKDRLD